MFEGFEFFGALMNRQVRDPWTIEETGEPLIADHLSDGPELGRKYAVYFNGFPVGRLQVGEGLHEDGGFSETIEWHRDNRAGRVLVRLDYLRFIPFDDALSFVSTVELLVGSFQDRHTAYLLAKLNASAALAGYLWLERVTTKQNFIIQVSIDSTDPAINYRSRGKTARVLSCLERLCASSLDVQLATVVNAYNVKNAHRIIEQYYPRIKRFHFLNVQRTASALANPEVLLDETEALDFWLRLKEYATGFPDDLFLPSLRVQLRALGNARVDPEASLHRQATFDCGVCSAGWTHVNVTSDFDVLGCDIAKDHSLMGNVGAQSFQEVWRSEAADKIRNAPFPACYKIASPAGQRLQDHLKPEYAGALH